MDRNKHQVYEVTHSIFNARNKGERIILSKEEGGRWKGPWYWGYFYRIDGRGRSHDKVRVRKLEGEFLPSAPTAPRHTGHMAVRE